MWASVSLPHQPRHLPAYTTFDAALQFALGEWDLDVNVKNLTNRKRYVGPAATTT